MNDSSAERHSLPASRAHRLLTLIGFSFIFFEIIFVYLYSDKFWFSLNIRWLGIPTIFVIAVIAHFVLKLLQSDAACALLFPLWRGKPPVAYTRFVDLDASGFTYGIRHIRWQAVDGLFLTILGNLEVRSDAFSGTVFKFPLGIAAPEDQKRFVDAVKQYQPNVRTNRRLEKRLGSALVKGQNAVQLAGASIMLVALLDLGYSSFNHLEMMKHYYLAEKMRSAAELEEADRMHENPIPISWVTNRFNNEKAAAAGVHQARAKAYAALGNLPMAVEETKKAEEKSPDDFRLWLLEARLHSKAGNETAAKAAIDKASELRPTFFLPWMYKIAAADKTSETAKRSTYESALKDFGESTFADEPRWPPGGNNAVRETLYSDDIHYVFDQLLHATQNQKN